MILTFSPVSLLKNLGYKIFIPDIFINLFEYFKTLYNQEIL